MNDQTKQNKTEGMGAASALSAGLGGTFAERLRIGMLASGLKAKQLAKATGMHETNVSHLLAGNREPNVENLAKLLRAMPGIDARLLICGCPPPNAKVTGSPALSASPSGLPG